MSDTVQFKMTLEITAKNRAVLTPFCVDHLKSIGWNVAPAHAEWESKRAFMKRLGLKNHDSVNRDIDLWIARGNNLVLHRTPQTGKLMEILSNSDFDAFCKRHKSPTKFATPQNGSSGPIQSRPFPARTVKRTESAGGNNEKATRAGHPKRCSAVRTLSEIRTPHSVIAP
jgi:hypothetical protein